MDLLQSTCGILEYCGILRPHYSFGGFFFPLSPLDFLLPACAVRLLDLRVIVSPRLLALSILSFPIRFSSLEKSASSARGTVANCSP